MIHCIQSNQILASPMATQLHMDEENKVIIFEKKKLIFIFNFSPSNAIFNYQFKAPEQGIYRILLNSDKKIFGGFDRVDDSIDYATDPNQLLSIYLTNRTALVLSRYQ